MLGAGVVGLGQSYGVQDASGGRVLVPSGATIFRPPSSPATTRISHTIRLPRLRNSAAQHFLLAPCPTRSVSTRGPRSLPLSLSPPSLARLSLSPSLPLSAASECCEHESGRLGA